MIDRLKEILLGLQLSYRLPGEPVMTPVSFQGQRSPFTPFPVRYEFLPSTVVGYEPPDGGLPVFPEIEAA